MQRIWKVFIIALSAILILGAAQPLPASAAPQASDSALTLVITNDTGANIYLTLSGEQNFSFSLGGGVSRVQVAKGKYEYRYYACSAWQTGTLEVKKDRQKFKLPACGGAKGASGSGNTLTLTVTNKTGANVYLILKGPQTYYLNVAGNKDKFEIVKGEYEYSYTACGKFTSGKVKYQRNNEKLAILSCSGNAQAPGTVKVTIENTTGDWMYLTLTGPSTYQFRLAAGKTDVYMLKGRYQFTVSGVCGSSTGEENIQRRSRWRFYCK